MLTRLKVNGFKNLVDVDVYFGPFTCIAGANGVGKSNLFDAIRFLSALADKPLVDAALSVRDEGGRTADLRSLFHRVGSHEDPEMSFEAEMIVPQVGTDDLGQQAQASITFLRYTIVLSYRRDESAAAGGALELRKEELVHINLGDAREHLPFPHLPSWRKSVIIGRRSGGPFISTDEGAARQVKLHQDRVQGRPLSRLATSLPRTVLSVTTAAESPTALLARREMQSWRLLQLEPSALRQPDEFTAGNHLGMDGAHLPATLYRLARPTRTDAAIDSPSIAAEQGIYAQVANTLSELIDDVRSVRVERDDRRELLTLYVTDSRGTSHPARALSDGTLRFLALAILLLEQESQGLICLEEPENGIHPERIPAILQLLQNIAVDAQQPMGAGNPLRQVIVNTHSPAIVSQVADDSLLVAEAKETIRDGRRFPRVCFSPLPDTWRAQVLGPDRVVSRAALMAYLNPFAPPEESAPGAQANGANHKAGRIRRVIDRSDLQLMLPWSAPTQ